MSTNRRMVPSVFLISTPASLSAARNLLDGSCKRSNTPRNPVPAMLAWMPALPNVPSTATMSLKSCPVNLVTAPANLNDCANWSRLTFVFVNVPTKTSLTIIRSLAAKPWLVIMFVTMSAARAMSSCAAAARFSTAGVAPIILFASNPALAKNSIPSAACDALKEVLAPSSRACAVRRSN